MVHDSSLLFSLAARLRIAERRLSQLENAGRPGHCTGSKKVRSKETSNPDELVAVEKKPVVLRLADLVPAPLAPGVWSDVGVDGAVLRVPGEVVNLQEKQQHQQRPLLQQVKGGVGQAKRCALPVDWGKRCKCAACCRRVLMGELAQAGEEANNAREEDSNEDFSEELEGGDVEEGTEEEADDDDDVLESVVSSLDSDDVDDDLEDEAIYYVCKKTLESVKEKLEKITRINSAGHDPCADVSGYPRRRGDHGACRHAGRW